MIQHHETLTILRRKQVEDRTGQSRSTIYHRMSDGTFVKPVRIGARAVGWPSHEVEALIAARIAGRTEDEIRGIVAKLEAARKTA